MTDLSKLVAIFDEGYLFTFADSLYLDPLLYKVSAGSVLHCRGVMKSYASHSQAVSHVGSHQVPCAQVPESSKVIRGCRNQVRRICGENGVEDPSLVLLERLRSQHVNKTEV